jgi:hypothetical protein
MKQEERRTITCTPIKQIKQSINILMSESFACSALIRRFLADSLDRLGNLLDHVLYSFVKGNFGGGKRGDRGPLEDLRNLRNSIIFFK